MYETQPWLQFYEDVPTTLDYPAARLDEMIARTAARVPDAVAYDFLGRTTTYRALHNAIERCAAGLVANGLRAGDRVTIALPTSPQGVIAFYAVARVGAVSSLIHPLSTADEIAYYLRLSGSRLAITLDALYEPFAEVREQTPLETLVLARIPDELPVVKRVGFWATEGRKLARVPRDANIVWWRALMSAPAPAPVPTVDPDGLATILYSGGTTGSPKGIMLSHRNVTSEALEVANWVVLSERDVMLAVLPIFHGFGLSALVHAGLISGAKLVMVPRFSVEGVAKLMRREQPTIIAGVPTIYERLARAPELRGADLSRLRAAFSGADILQPAVREAFETKVRECGGHVRLLEGYGLTEAVTAVICSPLRHAREGSVGLPLPDILAKVCKPATELELPAGEDGEICISGPPVMLGYLDNPEATAESLELHGDGRVWLRTGDLGHMDDDGYFWFGCRLKRMIKSSGFNVYPAQVETVLDQHPAVKASCVIGVPDTAQGERVKAFVVLQDPSSASDALASELIGHCRAQLIKWSCPRDVEFRSGLPVTRLGKIDYRALSDEERARVATTAPLTDRTPVGVA